MKQVNARQYYILSAHALQNHLNDGDEDICVDFGNIKATISIQGIKSAKPIEIKETKKYDSAGDNRSEERPDTKIRKAQYSKRTDGATNGQKTKVAD